MAADEISLREYFAAQFAALSDRLAAYVTQHSERHDKLAEEVIRAAAMVDKRLEGMNELRQQINTERGQFVTRDMLDQRLSGLEGRSQEMAKRVDGRIDEQAHRISEMERAKANMDGRFSMLAMTLTGIVILINLLFNWLLRTR